MIDGKEVALQFATALCAREYDKAYQMTSSTFRARMSKEKMQAQFEEYVPPDWGVTEPVEAVNTMQKGDSAWVYASISGDMYGEGLAATIMKERDRLAVSEVEWGEAVAEPWGDARES